MSVVRDFCGHGLGRLFHDEPNIVHVGRPGEGIVLKPGMFFTVEPMINLGRPHVKVLSDGWTAVTRDRSLSAQFEHSVGVTEDGVEIFTLSPRGLDKPPGSGRADAGESPHTRDRRCARGNSALCAQNGASASAMRRSWLARIWPRSNTRRCARACPRAIASLAEGPALLGDLLGKLPIGEVTGRRQAVDRRDRQHPHADGDDPEHTLGDVVGLAGKAGAGSGAWRCRRAGNEWLMHGQSTRSLRLPGGANSQMAQTAG